MMPGARISPTTCSVFLTVLLVFTLTSCSTIEPVQQEEIDQSQYIDPLENLAVMTSYSPPKMEPGYEQRLNIQYPRHLMRVGKQGTLVLRLYVSETGKVDYAAIEQSVDKAIDYPVQRKILAENLVPARLDGKPVKSVYRYEKEFKLHMIEVRRRVNNY